MIDPLARLQKLPRSWRLRGLQFAALAVMGTGLAACNEQSSLTANAKASQPIPAATLALMQEKGMIADAPILIRTYKKEADFEIWKMKNDGHYALLKTFPMCRWSGQLGPKTREGDRQVPEGFYTITPGQMNPNSNYYLSFNVGYPNAYDSAHGDTGGLIMVHGACSSAGCFSMTDEEIAEIYALAREAFRGGQRAVQMQSMPFHMTPENLAKYRLDPNIAFWKKLKEGADHFETTRQEVQVGVCDKQYVFDAHPAAPGERLNASAPCPALTTEPAVQMAVAQKQHRDDLEIAELISKGTPAIRTVYSDGGQNPEFANRVADVSRPEALTAGGIDLPVDPSGKTIQNRTVVATAAPTMATPTVMAQALAASSQSRTTAAQTAQAPVQTAIAQAAQAPAQTIAQAEPHDSSAVSAFAPVASLAAPIGSMFGNVFGRDPSNSPSTTASATQTAAAATDIGATTALPLNAPLPPRRHAAVPVQHERRQAMAAPAGANVRVHVATGPASAFSVPFAGLFGNR